MTVLVGVDIGTTSTKAIAYDEGGHLLAEESEAYELHSSNPGWAEQDPEEIFKAVLNSLSRMVDEVKKTNHEISGVSFSAAMHSLLALDKEGCPLTPSITYADTRATEQAERIRQELEGPELHRRTGTPIHPMSPLTKLLWFREEDPDSFEAAARWLSIKEYVFFRLFGEYVVDHSIASATGLFALEKLDWDEGALEISGISEEKLSRPVPTTHVMEGLLPEYADWLGLDHGTPFVVGANDGVLANLGLGVIDPGMVACSIGTSGAVRAVIPKPAVDQARSLFCYALTEDRWVVGGPINNGGIALQWAIEEVFPGLQEKARKQNRDTYELVSELLESVPAGSGG